MSRRRFAGAKGTLLTGPSELHSLSDDYKKNLVYQFKVDGMYVELHGDEYGKCYKIIGKNNKHVADRRAYSLMGVKLGPPGTILIGEVDAHTEAGISSYEEKGFADCHIFDALRVGGKDLRKSTYRTRRDVVQRMLAEEKEIINREDRPYTKDGDGRTRNGMGRYCLAKGLSWRRLPFVKSYPISMLDEGWATVLDEGREGLVIVDLNGLIGQRNGKLKMKPTPEMDAVVVHVFSHNKPHTAMVGTYLEDWAQQALLERVPVIGGTRLVFTVVTGNEKAEKGQVVSFNHSGVYGTNIPKHIRNVRIRHDIEPFILGRKVEVAN